MINGITFANPEFLYTLGFLIPILIFWYWKFRNKQYAELSVSNTQSIAEYKGSLKQRLRHLPFVLRLLSLSLLIVALARPQSSSKGQNVSTTGIDIIISMDISGSMLAEDFKPNRIEAAKKVGIEFIEGRPTDRIGLVIFAGESFTQCPMTTDHDVLKNLFRTIESDMLVDGTAIGEGLATAVNRLKDSKAKSKVIILLTDGVNNAGVIAPLTAAEIAKEFGIRVYSIGIGTKGLAPYPFKTPLGIQYQYMEVQIDEATMKQIAERTGGLYFRATDLNKLKAIYKEIDQLEKTKIEVTEFRKRSEEFLPFALGAAIFLIIEVITRYSIFKTLP